MTLSWERTRRNRAHTTESAHTTKSSYSREPSYSRGYSVHVTEIYYYFGSSGSVIFHTWPNSRLAFSLSPQRPLRPERLMKKTRLHILSRKIIWETMGSQDLKGVEHVLLDMTARDKRKGASNKGHKTWFSPSEVNHSFPDFRSYFRMEYDQPWNMGKISLEFWILLVPGWVEHVERCEIWPRTGVQQ